MRVLQSPRVCVSVFVSVCVCVIYKYVCVCLCVRVCVCMYVCMYVYIYILHTYNVAHTYASLRMGTQPHSDRYASTHEQTRSRQTCTHTCSQYLVAR